MLPSRLLPEVCAFPRFKKKKTLRKWESWDPGNKDLRQEKDEEDVEFGYYDESLLEAERVISSDHGRNI